MAKFSLAINYPLPHLPDNEQDHCHENIDLVNLLVLPSVQSACFRDQSVKLCQIFNKNSTKKSANTILAHIGKMIYFRENSNEGLDDPVEFFTNLAKLASGAFLADNE